MGRAKSIFFGPAPWGLGEGPKGQISFNFNYKVNFKDFLYQTLCVFSQMKDTKHIRRDLVFCPHWSCPRGVTLGRRGYPGGQIIFFLNMVMWSIKSTGMTSRTECKLYLHPRIKLVILVRSKVKYH